MTPLYLVDLARQQEDARRIRAARRRARLHRIVGGFVVAIAVAFVAAAIVVLLSLP